MFPASTCCSFRINTLIPRSSGYVNRTHKTDPRETHNYKLFSNVLSNVFKRFSFGLIAKTAMGQNSEGGGDDGIMI